MLAKMYFCGLRSIFSQQNFLYLISKEVKSPSYNKDSGRRDYKILPWAVKINFQCIMLYVVRKFDI